MRGDDVRARAFRQLVRHALGEPARIHRDERGAVRLDQRDKPIVDFLPDLVGHHRFERRAWHLDGEVDVPLVALVHDGNGFTGEEARHFLDRLLRRRKADALQLAACVVEALERQREARRGATAVRRGSRRR